MMPPPPPPSMPQQPQPGYGGPAPYALPEAQGALPAMILGIIALVLLPLACCCGVGSLASIVLGILALVFGIMARNRINASGGTLGGSGKAMAGIICGGIAVGLAVIGAIVYFIFLASSGSILNALNNAIQTPTP
jgi:hypothetical protein